MIKKVLLAIDTSEYSKRGVPLAAEIAEKFGAEVTVLHVREWIFGSGGPFDEGAKEAEQLVEAAVGELKGAGLTAKGEVLGDYFGHTARRIVAVADVSGADLIVLGSRGVSNLTGILLGDVVHKVLQLATVPVLVVR
jgi:nucleotide-binding universal stress UspA family protein